MAVRQCGWAMLSSNTPREVMDLGLVSHLATAIALNYGILRNLPENNTNTNTTKPKRINDGEIKLNLAIDSPRSSSGPSQSQSHSNDSTPCSSPPQSPNHKIPLGLTPKNSIDEHLHNHWVIKHDHHILYYTIDNEYPPSYGWKYNEKTQSALPKQYNLINFGAPPPDITRIPIIPEPMITFMDNDAINHKNGKYFTWKKKKKWTNK